MLKKIISIAISAIAVSCIVGCSNQSPVSVSESSNTIEKTAVISDPDHRMLDISGYTPHLWGACIQDPVPGTLSDYYLYYYRPSTASWVRSTHWASRVAVTCFGKCFHSNGYFNQVYCCKTLDLNGANERDSSGFVAAAPTGERIIDIAAGAVQANVDRVWVLCANGATRSIYKGDVTNGVFQSQGWTFVSSWNSINTGIYVNGIAADPVKGGRVIIATNHGADTLTSNNTWVTLSNSQTGLDDVAWNATAVFYATCRVLFYHYIGSSSYIPTRYADGVSDHGFSVAGSKVWWLGHDALVHSN
jgi:hypothetical protein